MKFEAQYSRQSFLENSSFSANSFPHTSNGSRGIKLQSFFPGKCLKSQHIVIPEQILAARLEHIASLLLRTKEIFTGSMEVQVKKWPSHC